MRVIPHTIDGARVVASRYKHVTPDAIKGNVSFLSIFAIKLCQHTCI